MNSGRERVERRLAAVLAADVAGYSRLMGEDEEGTHAALTALRRELTDPKIAAHRGRVVKGTGDGFLAEFASVVDAVRSAVELQRAMALRNDSLPRERHIEFRIGINLGDIIIEDDDIYGDGVNVAARLEALAEPGGICVSRVVRDQVRDKLDLVFVDMGEQQVKNIARPVRVYRIATGQEPRPRPPLTAPDKPSLAVLPFQNMSDDINQDYFVDGIVEEITTAISRLPWLFVIARNSSFTYKGKAVDVKQVARELGVRYVLEGSLRKSVSRVRITGQLIDAATSAHIWADRFDGAMDDIFELQDQVASSVVGAIEPRLRLSEIERAARKPTESLDAYDLYLRALAEVHKHSEDGMRGALALLKRALILDPGYAPAAAMIGFCRTIQKGRGWGPLSDSEIAEGLNLARQALETGKDDPDVLWMAGDAISVLGRDHATAAVVIDRALKLNPNSANAWMAKGWMECNENHPRPAIDSLERAIQLSPLDPLNYFFTGGLAFAYLLAGQYQEAAEWADRCFREQPRYTFALRVKMVACAYLGRVEEARSAVTRLLELYPKLTIASWRVSTVFSAQIWAIFEEGLRKAGLPEE
jgi:adenylate cyclase